MRRWESSEFGAGGNLRGRRRGASRKTTLRRAALERLEERALMAVLPTPTAVGPVNISGPLSGGDPLFANESTPAIAVNRYNPNQLVAAWTLHRTDVPTPPLIFAQAAVSTDGGQSWNGLFLGGHLPDPNTTNPTIPYTRSADASVAFDNQGNAYVLTRQTNDGGDSGALVLSKFNLGGGTPVAVFTGQVVYQWLPTSDQALSPTLAVDDGVASYTDPTTGITRTNPHAGNVYVAWHSVDIPPAALNPVPPTYNPNRIIAVASVDGGQSFGSWTVVNDNGNFGDQRNARPRLAISQGGFNAQTGTTIPAGQVTVVWDDFASLATNAPPLDIIEADSLAAPILARAVISAGAPQSFFFNAAASEVNKRIPPVGSSGTTTSTIPAVIPAGQVVSDVNVQVRLTHTFVGDLQLALIAPDGTRVRLATNRGGFGDNFTNTTFDDSAATSIGDPGALPPFTGSFRPEEPLAGFIGRAGGGAWQLEIVDGSSGDTGTLEAWSLSIQTIGGSFTITDAATGTPNHVPATTQFPLTINIADPSFRLNDLDLALSVIHPAVQELSVELVPPVGSGLPPIRLLNNQVQPDGTAINTLGISGANLGFPVATVFDDDATRNIQGIAAPASGHFRSEGGIPAAYQNATPAQLNGTWQLRFVDNRNNNVGILNRAELILTSGFEDGPDRTVAFTTVRATVDNTSPTAALVHPLGIGPGVAIASDNTLGSFSPFQGRLYVTYVHRIDDIRNPADNTDIFLSTSDDGGLTWINRGRVNDDDADRDGFSGADDGLGPFGELSGRPQFQPSVAVDQATGTLVLSWLDARHDAARSRVATFLTTSIDGGRTFSAQDYLNADLTAIDALTGQVIVRGPVPENQSPGGGIVEGTFSFGDRQGLAVHGGRAIAAWSSNINGGADGKSRLDIRAATATYAAGPRVVESTMGPVAAPLTSFDVVLDRPIDPASFRPNDVQVFYRDTTAGNTAGEVVPIFDVLPVASQPGDPDFPYNPNNVLGNTRFRVVLAGGGRSAVGTYSYTVGPNLNDRIRRANGAGGTIAPGNLLDQDADASTGEAIVIGPGGTLGDVYAAPRPTSTGQGLQLGSNGFFVAPFDPNTLPIIVSGPHVVRTEIPGAGASPDNVALDRPVNAIDLTFDRPMRIGSFTGSDVLRLQGPIGELAQPRTLPAQADQVNRPIPDATGIPLLSTLTLVDDGTFRVGDMDVALSITHPSTADLTAVLIAPDGTRVTLFSGVGGAGANFTDTILDDQAFDPITTAGAPFTGRFRPAEALAALAGKELRGTWTLEVTDGTGNNAGTLVSWALLARPLIQVSAAHNATVNPNDPASSRTLNRAIPDNGSTLAVPLIVPNDGGAFTIDNLTVSLDINHLRPSDLIVELVAPDGITIVPLMANIGGLLNPNVRGLTLDQRAGRPITATSAPFTGTYRPVTTGGNSNTLATLAGRALQGTWTLRVRDTVAGNAGTLNAWSLAATTTSLTANATTFRVALPSQLTSGNYSLSLSPQIQSSNGEFLDTNQNAGVSLLKGTPPFGTEVPEVVTSADVPRAIADLLTTRSTVTINDSFLINDLNVTVDISHLNDPDLTAVLVGPDGTRVTLFSNVGAVGPVGTRRNFTRTTLDDQATTPITSGAPPFFGTFRPQGLLSAFNGKDALGTWALEVTDNATGNTGTLNTWSMTFQTTSDYAAADASPASPLPLPTQTTTTSTVFVGDNFLIADADVTLNITHPNTPDLRVVLIAPDGTRVRLAEGAGASGLPGTRQNFTRTTFDDQAPTLIQSGTAPFTGRFRPMGDVGTTLATLNGKNAFGTWTLEITNGSAVQTGGLTGWSLVFRRPSINSGLGEPVADRVQVDFRVFNMDPSNPLSSAGWTPVGPAASNSVPENRNGYSGRISSVAVDPSDASGNTVYIGAASGGVWKTTNFLTNDPGGPSWVPLTDFGPTLSLNIASIAVFGRNNDPNQSILFALTGEGEAQYGWGSTTNPNAQGSTGRGVGLLRSLDGGATWTLLDSTDNTLDFGARDHLFTRATGYKVAVDPTPTLTGDVIVYAAMGDSVPVPGGQPPAGGLWRSLDTGRTWQKMSVDAVHGTTATDIVLELNSTSVSTGLVDTLFVAFQGVGVFSSPNRGQNLNLMTGAVGLPQIRDAEIAPPPAIPTNITANPNGPGGRIVLASTTPVPVYDPNSTIKNLLYKRWLYAAVANLDGTLRAVYVTKDNGQTWTDIDLAYVPWPFAGRPARPTNDSTQPDYDVAASPTFPRANYNLALTVDPNNPMIIYLGGTSVGQESGLIRIDTSTTHDSHAFTFGGGSAPDGGDLFVATLTDGTSAALVKRPEDGPGFLINEFPRRQYFNLIQDPRLPFDVNSTLLVGNTASQVPVSIANDGTNTKWRPIDEMLFANGPQNDFRPSTNVHQLTTIRDPYSGLVRLIAVNDMGIFTGVQALDGSIDPGIGNAQSPTFARTGNLQISQFYRGAAQPSTLAAQVAGAMLYGASHANGYPQSDPGVLDNGQTQWFAATSGELDGSDVATDSQGLGTVYQYKMPALGGGFTNFFQVDGIGRTFGLLQSPSDPQWPGFGQVYPGLIPMGRFAVNPLNGDQLIISSNAGRIFGTTDQGRLWQVIGDPADLDGTYAPAVAYGAPDPTAPGGIGNLGNFLYAGTIGGRIFMSRTGGGFASNSWLDITNGDLLADRDAAIAAGQPVPSVVEIITSPDRGSHIAYAATLGGVYVNTETVNGGTWRRISGTGAGNLFAIRHAPFGDASKLDQKLDFLTALKVDWRYAIPDDLNDPDSATHPVLYVAGNSGVYRSIDNGETWTLFPAMVDGALSDGGFLPSVHVTDLDLAIGRIDPSTGRPVVDSSSPNVLIASTFGRGTFAIRLAPQVFADSRVLGFAPGSDSGADANDRVTNVVTPTIQGLSAQSAFGSAVTVTLFDLTDPSNPVVIGTGTTDDNGRFSITVAPGHFLPGGSTDGVKTLGVQATDQAGTRGNLAPFTFTLDTRTPLAATTPDLQDGSDSGLSATDDLTNVTAPVLNIGGVERGVTLRLYRNPADLNNLTDPVAVLTDVSPSNLDPVTGLGIVAIQDPGLVVDGVHTYVAVSEDRAGNISPVSGVLTIRVDTLDPDQPPAPRLFPDDDSGIQGDNITGVAQPRFTGTAEAGGIIQLIDLAGNVIGTATVAANGTYVVQPESPFPADGSYDLRVVAVDVAGNASVPSPVLRLTITSRPPGAPTLSMVRVDDSGSNPNDNVTNVRRPRFTGETSAAGLTVLLIDITGGTEVPLGTTASGADRTYLVQPGSDLSHGVHVLVARVRDAAGNEATSPPLTVTIDTQAPGAPPSLTLRAQDDTGRPGDNVTSSRRPTFEGTAEPGAVVDIIRASDGEVLATGVAHATTGAYSLRLAQNLVNGRIGLQARVRDLAGNAGTPSAALLLTVVTASDDFDGDAKADPTVWRPANGLWSIAQSASGRRFELLGQPGDIPVRGDFDGDGRADIGVYRTATGQFIINRSTAGPLTQSVGIGPVSLPVTADFDGDGRTDLGVFDTTSATWFVLRSSLGATAFQFGRPGGTDTPLVGDFNGDGKADVAVFWAEPALVLAANTGTNGALGAGTRQLRQFGRPGGGDTPLIGDWNGDGRSDIGLHWSDQALFLYGFTGNDGTLATDGGQVRQFGRINADVPVPDDYDADGRTDTAVYWADTGQFLISYSGGGALVTIPGTPGDLPLQAPVKYLKANSRLGTGGTVTTAGFTPAAATSAAGSLNLGRTAASLSNATPTAAAQAQAQNAGSRAKVVTQQGADGPRARLGLAAVRRFLAQHRAARRNGR
jgi:subtilisin-like proprotein convertase family protein